MNQTQHKCDYHWIEIGVKSGDAEKSVTHSVCFTICSHGNLSTVVQDSSKSMPARDVSEPPS